MRCDGRSIQDKTPEGADRRNIIILYNMPLSNIQRHSKVFTHSTLTPFSLVFQEKEKKNPTPHTKTTTKKMKVVNGDESKPIIHSKNIKLPNMHSKGREDEHQDSTNKVHTLRKLNLSSKVDHSHLPLASIFSILCFGTYFAFSSQTNRRGTNRA